MNKYVPRGMGPIGDSVCICWVGYALVCQAAQRRSLLLGRCGTTETASQMKLCQRRDLKDGYWRDRRGRHSWQSQWWAEDARTLERSMGAAGFGDKSCLSVFSAIGRKRTMVTGSWKPLRAMNQCNSQFSPLGSLVGCGLETGQLGFCIRIQMRNSECGLGQRSRAGCGDRFQGMQRVGLRELTGWGGGRLRRKETRREVGWVALSSPTRTS